MFAAVWAHWVLSLRFLSQLEYLAAGAAGLPVFAHGGGLLALLGPTSGYLMAFPAAALIAGFGAERVGRRGAVALLTFPAGVLSIYVLGAAWFAVWAAVLGGAAGLAGVLAQSVYPFALIDLVKAAFAAGLSPLARRLVQ